MRRLSLLLVPLLLLSACATGTGRKTGTTDQANDQQPAYAEPLQPIVGRIAAVNTRLGAAVVALDPQGARIFRAEGWSFESRRDDLTTTARLSGTRRRSGNSLGVIILEGTPAVGDEVVLSRPR